MMSIKKLSNYFVRYFLVFIVMGVYIMEPMRVNATDDAETLRDLKNELAELRAKKRENEQKEEMTEDEISQKQDAIEQANRDIANARNDIDIAKAQIEDYNERIAELDQQTQELMSFYQIMNGNNAYMEFITDSSSMTELIMRADAIEQLTNYNQEKLIELEELIEANEELQVELLEKQNALEARIVEYDEQIGELQDNLAGLFDITLSIDDEIAMQEEKIAYYEDIGCEDDDILSVCEGSIGSNSTWLKPLVRAYVSSAYGYRSFNGGSFHHGIDLAGISEGTPIYSIGTGIVRAVRDAKNIRETTGKKSCGGNLIYIEYNILGQTYTVTYGHVLDIYVSVGDRVDGNTIVATVGGGSNTWDWDIRGKCTTGTHLHFQISEGTHISTTTANPYSIEPPGYPNKGSWFYSRTQWFA